MTPRLCALACVALVAATPIFVWWAVGDLSSPGFSKDQLDYAVVLPDWSPAAVRNVGIVAGAIVVLAAVLLLRAFASRWLHRRWVSVVGALVAVGVMVGFGGRVLTAGGIGANIGAGLMVMFAFPVAAILVLFALVESLSIVRSSHQTAPEMRR